MEPLTDQRQWRLGLGMMIADPSSPASSAMRRAGIALLEAEVVVPPSWKAVIQTYLMQRIARKRSQYVR